MGQEPLLESQMGGRPALMAGRGREAHPGGGDGSGGSLEVLGEASRPSQRTGKDEIGW